MVGIKAIHLVSRDEEKKVPKTDAFYLDIGAKDREEALSRVEPGTYGSFVCTPEEFGEGLFKAKAIDDRVGCAVLLKLLEEDLPMDVVFVFTAQEEVLRRPPWCWRPPPPLTCPGWRDTAGCAPPAGAL